MSDGGFCHDEAEPKEPCDGNGECFRLSAELSRLEAENARLREDNLARASFMGRRGYRRCDIPACNCNGWHGGHAEQRLGEIEDALMDADIDTNGKTILAGVKEATSKLSALIASVREIADAMLREDPWTLRNYIDALQQAIGDAGPRGE